MSKGAFRVFMAVLVLFFTVGAFVRAADAPLQTRAATAPGSPPAVQPSETTEASIAQSKLELEQLAARLPITLDSDGRFTPLTIDPYADRDPADVWNDWRMENLLDREPPLMVITAHNMWAYLHGLPSAEETQVTASRQAEMVRPPFTSESLSAAVGGPELESSAQPWVGNFPPGAPVLGEDAEIFMSVDPNNPLHIVAGCNHRLLYDSTCTSVLSVSGVTLNSNGGQELYSSTDGGTTWSHQCAPWHSGTAYTLTTSNGTSPFTFQASDPSIAWDTSGNAYFFMLPWWSDASGSYSGNATTVVKWTAATNTWSAVATPESYINACTTTTCNDTLDKTIGGIDTTSGGAYSHTNRMVFLWVHLHWTGTAWTYTMRRGYSDPPYTSWTVNDFAPGGTTEVGTSVTRLAGSIAVAADGTIYFAWDRNLTTGSQQMISKSTDGGVTWSAAVQMSSTAVLTDFGASTKIAAQDTRGIALLPMISVDACPTSAYKGRLYEAYTDYHSGVTSGNDTDVYVRRSTDGGSTWSTVATLAGIASTTSQFLPTTTVDQSTGTVSVVWYDTSNADPTNNRKVQVYVSQSTDGGTTWSAQKLVTDAGENFSHHYNYLDENSTDMPAVTTLHHYQYGEYMSASSSNGKLWIGWTDSRNWLTENGGDTEYEDLGATWPASLSASPNIVYQSHGTLTQVTGNGDAYFDKGEKWSVSVTLTNLGNLTANNVTATFGGNGITVCTPTQSFGSIAPGGTASATFVFVISSTFSPCGGAVNFNITSKTSSELSPAGSNENGVFSINVGAPGSSTQLVVQPSTADTEVRQNSATTNYGTATTMTTNVRASGFERDVLVQFDLSGIPAGATITSATLELYNTTAPASAYAVDVLRNTASWVETSVTWNTKPAFDLEGIAQITPTTAVGWKIWTVTSAVQNWYSGTWPNYGFTVKPDWATGTTNVLYTFATREYTTNTAYRPILRVTYTPNTCSYTGSGTCCNAPTGLTNNTAADPDLCADGGVQVSWPQDVSNWGDGGAGTRTYDVLRNSTAIATGIAYGTTSYTDTTGVNGTSYTYSVRYNNGCGSSATTTGASAYDNVVTCTALDQCHLVGTCNPSTGLCSNPNAPDGTQCGPAPSGACDLQDTCSAGACVDNLRPYGYVCRAAAGVCDIAEVCTGTNADCPADAFVPANTVCRAAAGVCDVAEVCTGTNADCPADVFQPNGTGCDDATVCNGHEVCNNGACQGGTALNCDDGISCTIDACDPLLGCQHSDSCPGGQQCSAVYDLCEVTAATISLPSDAAVTACPVGEVAVPITVNPGTGIRSFDLAFTYNAAVVTPTSVSKGALTTDPSWTLTYDLGTSGQVLISLTGTSGLTGGGEVALVVFTPASAPGASSNLSWTKNLLNGHEVAPTPVDGAVNVITTCSIAGSVLYYRDAAAPGEPSTKPTPNVNVKRTQGATTDTQTTGAAGTYAFPGLYGSMTVEALNKYGSPRAADENGAITSFDASQVSRFMVHYVTFTGDQMLAADVTGDKTVSSYDASFIARYSVQMVNHFPVATATGSDWKFLACTSYPTCLDQPVYSFDPLTQAETSRNFYAILYGDVTGDWQPAGSRTSRSSSPEEQAAAAADLQLAQQLQQNPPTVVTRSASSPPAELSFGGWQFGLRAGQKQQVTVSVNYADGIFGLDLGLQYDPSRIAIVDVKSATRTIGWTAVHGEQAGAGRIAAFGIIPLSGSGSFLTITVQALQDLNLRPPFSVSSAVANEGQIAVQVKGWALPPTSGPVPSSSTP